MKDRRPLELLRHSLIGCAAVGLLGLGGCSYLAARRTYTPTVDTRLQLGRDDAASLTARELPDYTCTANYVLLCERGASTKYDCTCALR